MMYGSWDMKCNRQNSLWTIFCPFTLLTTQKIKILKNWKNTWRYYHFTHVYDKWQSYDVWFLRYEAWWTEFFVILDCFLPFYPLTTWTTKTFKNWKSAWRYHNFMHVYHKQQSNDVWFLRYWVQQTDFFVIFQPFFAILPLNNLEYQNFEIIKKLLEVIWFYTCVP